MLLYVRLFTVLSKRNKYLLFLIDYLKEWVRSSELAAIQPARFINDSGDTEEI